MVIRQALRIPTILVQVKQNCLSKSHIDYVDLALPGMLPVLNKECLKIAIKASLALRGTIGNKLKNGKF